MKRAIRNAALALTAVAGLVAFTPTEAGAETYFDDKLGEHVFYEFAYQSDKGKAVYVNEFGRHFVLDGPVRIFPNRIPRREYVPRITCGEVLEYVWYSTIGGWIAAPTLHEMDIEEARLEEEGKPSSPGSGMTREQIRNKLCRDERRFHPGPSVEDLSSFREGLERDNPSHSVYIPYNSDDQDLAALAQNDNAQLLNGLVVQRAQRRNPAIRGDRGRPMRERSEPSVRADRSPMQRTLRVPVGGLRETGDSTGIFQ